MADPNDEIDFDATSADAGATPMDRHTYAKTVQPDLYRRISSAGTNGKILQSHGGAVAVYTLCHAPTDSKPDDNQDQADVYTAPLLGHAKSTQFLEESIYFANIRTTDYSGGGTGLVGTYFNAQSGELSCANVGDVEAYRIKQEQDGQTTVEPLTTRHLLVTKGGVLTPEAQRLVTEQVPFSVYHTGNEYVGRVHKSRDADVDSGPQPTRNLGHKDYKGISKEPSLAPTHTVGGDGREFLLLTTDGLDVLFPNAASLKTYFGQQLAANPASSVEDLMKGFQDRIDKRKKDAPGMGDDVCICLADLTALKQEAEQQQLPERQGLLLVMYDGNGERGHEVVKDASTAIGQSVTAEFPTEQVQADQSRGKAPPPPGSIRP